jgi:hypothetical protein
MTRGWLAVVLALAACATSPKATVERAATPPAAKNPPPECDPAHDDTLVDGLVVIRPGETLCIAVTAMGDVVVPARVVSTSEGSIMLRSWREGPDVFLTIRSPFSRRLKYRAGIVLAGEVRPREAKTCPALSDYRPTLEQWPRLVDEILLTDFRLLPEGASVVCE